MTLFTFSLNKNLDWDLLKKYICYISKERQERIKKFVSNNSKSVSLMTEMLLRFSLITEFEVNNKQIEFEYNENGKPNVLGIVDCHFSISHSNHVICISTNSFPVGIDIEFYRNINFEIAKKFFTKNEYKKILSDINPVKTFFEIWTQKEACAKLLGLNFLKTLSSPEKFPKKVLFHSMHSKSCALSVALLNMIPKIKTKQISLNEILEKLKYR